MIYLSKKSTFFTLYIKITENVKNGRILVSIKDSKKWELKFVQNSVFNNEELVKHRIAETYIYH